MSHLTHIKHIQYIPGTRSFLGRFYGSHNPTNSVTVLKGYHLSTTSRANPTRLSSLEGNVKNVTPKN